MQLNDSDGVVRMSWSLKFNRGDRKCASTNIIPSQMKQTHAIHFYNAL